MSVLMYSEERRPEYWGVDDVATRVPHRKSAKPSVPLSPHERCAHSLPTAKMPRRRKDCKRPVWLPLGRARPSPDNGLLEVKSQKTLATPIVILSATSVGYCNSYPQVKALCRSLLSAAVGSDKAAVQALANLREHRDSIQRVGRYKVTHCLHSGAACIKSWLQAWNTFDKHCLGPYRLDKCQCIIPCLRARVRPARRADKGGPRLTWAACQVRHQVRQSMRQDSQHQREPASQLARQTLRLEPECTHGACTSKALASAAETDKGASKEAEGARSTPTIFPASEGACK